MWFYIRNIVIIALLVSCNRECKNMGSSAVGIHRVNRSFTDNNILDCIGAKEISLIVNNDGTFIIESNPSSCIDKANGTWSTKSGLEGCYYKFQLEGLPAHETPSLGVLVKCNSQAGILEFRI